MHALKGIDIAFRENEFVSILGQSGCGKTTLLNIIGGLDRYTSGDLIINGKSTREFKDRDWDTYRNHSIGFVFQSYNLIPHQNGAVQRGAGPDPLRRAENRAAEACRGSPRKGRPGGPAEKEAQSRCPAGRCSGWPSPGRW